MFNISWIESFLVENLFNRFERIFCHKSTRKLYFFWTFQLYLCERLSSALFPLFFPLAFSHILFFKSILFPLSFFLFAFVFHRLHTPLLFAPGWTFTLIFSSLPFWILILRMQHFLCILFFEKREFFFVIFILSIWTGDKFPSNTFRFFLASLNFLLSLFQMQQWYFWECFFCFQFLYLC